MAQAADLPGASPSPARRLLRRTGALLATAPLLATLPLLTGAYPADAAATGTSTVEVDVNSLSPNVPRDSDTIKITGTVTNKGHQTVTDAHVGLRVGVSYTSRSAIDTAARNSSGGAPDGTEVASKYAEKFAKLTPGVPQNFTLSVPVKALHLGADGVYELGVGLMGQTAAQQYQHTLGIQRTFLPWQPDGADTKTRTTVLWPLISRTALTAETGTGEQQTPVFDNDNLAEEIGPGGRLQQMLDLGRDLDVTWVVDPDLLASVDAMTEAYKVKGKDGSLTPGKHQAVAKEWLNKLQRAVRGQKVVTLPYADPDLASLAHSGTKVAGSLAHLKDATDAATPTVDTILHAKADTSYAWPAEGALDPDIVKVATSAGASKIIARSDTFRETGNLPYTPSAARPIGGGTTAVVADARLSTAFDGDMTRAENSTLAVQRFLAQSLALNRQTTRERHIVVAPQRMPSVSQAQALATAVHALQGGTWSRAQTLSAAASAKPDPGAATRVPSAHAYPSSLRRHELHRSAYTQIQDTQRGLETFMRVLTSPSRVVTPFGRAMDRELSTSWRGDAKTAREFRDGVSGYLSGLTEQVALIDKSEVKLSGRSATIPVSVQNNLWQDVDHLVLRLTSNNGTRLKIGGGPYQDQPVKIVSGHSQSVKFTTSAKATGPVIVRAQLFTEDGQPYGKAVAFKVDVTEITPTVMLVVAGGVLLLVLAGFRMYTQRKRAAAARDTAGPQDDTGTVQAAAPEPTAQVDVPKQAGDPTADTSAQSAAPSGTSERVER
ncbi:DUF6049 family protein [Streptomyces beihaiensis]|uniref:DUF6049 family protein n=1 Tax=Streptomyces beihaiensis TaxID=2984495 RepID=A0ABT3U338_9ACTN|nr:DUF6049 family protein [Streptomyces beihaiensis]MCX3063731.1 DUF6049 family protein [Streptomyces beihaiensis]